MFRVGFPTPLHTGRSPASLPTSSSGHGNQPGTTFSCCTLDSTGCSHPLLAKHDLSLCRSRHRPLDTFALQGPSSPVWT
eukprot:8122252-Lingulodinium_polyedra.AAC.1